MRRAPACFAALLAWPGLALAEGPVVAVLDLRDPSRILLEDSTAELRRYLASRLAEGGRFQVVPEAKLKAALASLKEGSYQQCVDEACQLELGRELAAQKVLVTEVVELGTSCAVTATLFDLSTAASERAATHRGGCKTDELVVSLEQVAAKLRGDPGGAPPSAVLAGAPAAPPPPPARIYFFTHHPDLEARVTISGAGGASVSCPAPVRRGAACALATLPEGPRRYEVDSALGRFSEPIEGETARYELTEESTPLATWLRLGAGLGAAGGVALVGAGIWSEEKAPIYAGLPTLVVAVAGIFAAELLDGRLAVELREAGR